MSTKDKPNPDETETPDVDSLADTAASIYMHARSIEASAAKLRDDLPGNDAAAIRAIVKDALAIAKDAAVVVIAGIWAWTTIIAPMFG